MSARVLTGQVRASYVNVFQTRINELSGNEEYGMMILIPKSDKKTVQRIKSAIEHVKAAKWGKKVPTKLRNPLRDGDSIDDLPESVEAGDEPYAGHFFMNIKSQNKPEIVDKNLQEIIDQSEFRSGDYCRVTMNAYAYDTKGNRGVAFGLNNIQVLEKGESLGGRTRAEDDFEEVADEDYDFLDDAA